MLPSIQDIELGRAVQKGDLSRVTQAIRSGANVDAELPSTDTCGSRFKYPGRHFNEHILSHASRLGNVKIVDALINAGANVDIDDYMPMYEAVENGNLELVKRLIRAGANLSQEDDIIELAAWNGNLQILKELIRTGVNYRKNAGNILIKAVEENHLHVVKYLITPKYLGGAGIPVNAGGYFFRDGEIGLDHATALVVAAHYGYLDIVKLLVRSGARINERDEYGVTALDMARQRGHTAIVNYLLTYKKQRMVRSKLVRTRKQDHNYVTVRNMTCKIRSGSGPRKAKSLPSNKRSTQSSKRKVKSLPNRKKPIMVRPRKLPIDLVRLIADYAGDNLRTRKSKVRCK